MFFLSFLTNEQQDNTDYNDLGQLLYTLNPCQNSVEHSSIICDCKPEFKKVGPLFFEVNSKYIKNHFHQICLSVSGLLFKHDIIHILFIYTIDNDGFFSKIHIRGLNQKPHTGFLCNQHHDFVSLLKDAINIISVIEVHQV